ncbi:MAG: Calx-beta domain-containing protein [Panacibacter sp.]
MKTHLLVILCCITALNAKTQTTGDYRSKATGNWNAASSWQRYNGANWVNAPSAPSSADGVITIQAFHTITNTTAITVDQLTVNVNSTFVQNAAMTVSNGPGTDLTVYGKVEFRGTTTTIQSNAQLSLNGYESIVYASVINDGIIDWNSEFLSFDGGSITNNNQFNAGDSNVLFNYTTGMFTNSTTGTFTKNSPRSTRNGVDFINNGTVNFDAGKFINSKKITNTGALNFTGGDTLENDATNFGSIFLNAGTTITGTGTIIHGSGDTLQINLGFTLPAGITLVLNSGIITGTGSLKITGNMYWIGGKLGLNSTLQPTGVINISGYEQILYSTLTNNGTINWNSDYFSFNGGKFINNKNFNITGNGDMFNYGGGSVTNGTSGIVSKTSTGITSVSQPLPFTNNGTIKGVGTFNFGTNLNNKGTFAPGNSIGILTTGTGYTNKTLEIEMQDGSGAGSGHDELLVNGNVKLSGSTLKIIRTGIVPEGSYTILSSTGNISDSFGTITAPDGFTVSKVGKTMVVNVPNPLVSINDIIKTEGKKMNFTVSLSYPSNLTTKVNYQTVDSTATVANNDYADKSGTLTFAPGELTKTVNITTKQDAVIEPDEVFYVKLLTPDKLTIKKEKGIGTIENDDGPLLMAGNRSAINEKQTADKLLVPNFLHRNQHWNIAGLSGLNATIAIVDAKGNIALKLNNYQSSADMSRLVPGLYFYQVLYKDADQKSKITTGKLVVAD